jgi:hypothetical protein
MVGGALHAIGIVQAAPFVYHHGIVLAASLFQTDLQESVMSEVSWAP